MLGSCGIHTAIDIRVIGVHRVECSDEEFESAMELMWGSGLSGRDLERARKHTREQFDGLRLIEIEVSPADTKVDWSRVTQAIPGVDGSSWQVAYDEERLDAARGRWAFFLHYVQSEQPLMTPAGDRALPAVTPLPQHLAHKTYDTP